MIFLSLLLCACGEEPVSYFLNDGGVDSETASDTDIDTDGDTDIDTDGDTDIDTDGDTDIDTDGDTDTDTDGDTDTDTDGDTDTDTDGDTDTDTDSDTDTDTDSDTDTDVDTDTDTDTDADNLCPWECKTPSNTTCDPDYANPVIVHNWFFSCDEQNDSGVEFYCCQPLSAQGENTIHEHCPPPFACTYYCSAGTVHKEFYCGSADAVCCES
jgi:hypothetical protein